MLQDATLYYIDYECNDYMEQWLKAFAAVKLKIIIKEPDVKLTDLWQITIVWELDREKIIFRKVLDYGNVESVAWLPQT